MQNLPTLRSIITGILSAYLCLNFSHVLFAAEEVMVLGEKTTLQDNPILVDKKHHTGFISSINRSDFEDRFTQITEILADIPSIQIKSNGGFGAYSSTSLRGSTGKQVNVFLDGLLLNSPFSGHANLNNVPTSIIESIDVYPDFTPIELSTANLAGAISFTSRYISAEETGLQASLGYGSFDSQSGELSAWTNHQQWQLLGAISALRSENDYPVNKEDFATSSDTRINDQYKGQSTFLKAARQWKNIRLQLLYQSQQNDKGVPTAKNRLADNATVSTDSQQLQSVIDYNIESWEVSHRLFIAEENTDFDDANGTVGLRNDHVVTEQNGGGIFNIARINISQNTLAFGLNLRHDKTYQEDISTNEIKAGVTRQSAVASVSHSFLSKSDSVFTTTIRQYFFKDTINQHTSIFAEDASANTFSWQTGFNIALNKHWNFLSNLGKTIRLPTILEKFGNSGLYIGNDELKEETALIIDTGLKYQTQNLTLYSVFFTKDITDGIYTIYDSRGVGRPENIGAATIYGNESNLSYQLNKSFNWSINSTFMDSENLSEIKAFKGKMLPGIYHINYGSSLSYQFKFIGFRASYQLYDALYYNSANAVKAEAKEELDISATLYLEPVTLDFSIRNALDQRIMDYNRMPSPGRSYFLTVTINL